MKSKSDLTRTEKSPYIMDTRGREDTGLSQLSKSMVLQNIKTMI